MDEIVEFCCYVAILSCCNSMKFRLLLNGKKVENSLTSFDSSFWYITWMHCGIATRNVFAVKPFFESMQFVATFYCLMLACPNNEIRFDLSPGLMETSNDKH